jgi:enterobacterial common antigen flippase
MQGLRRIRLLAIAAPAGAAVGTVATVVALGAGADPVKAALVLPFAGEALVVLALSRRLARPRRRISLPDTARGIVSLTGLGWVFVINATLVALGQLAVRLLIEDDLGRSAVGLYQAAFGISAVASAFVIQALTLDYYPRLSGARSDADAHRMVSEQLRLSLLIAAPAILVAIVAAPVLLQIAFSPAFTDAAMTLRWQLVGDLARVAAWTIGFLLVVHEQRLAFVANEAVLNTVWIGATAAFLSVGGLAAAGAAFAFANAAIIPVVLLWARRSAGFRMELSEGRLILALVLLAVAVASLGAHGRVGLVAQVALVLPAAWYSLRMAGRLADTRPSMLLRSLRDRSQATAP